MITSGYTTQSAVRKSSLSPLRSSTVGLTSSPVVNYNPYASNAHLRSGSFANLRSSVTGSVVGQPQHVYQNVPSTQYVSTRQQQVVQTPQSYVVSQPVRTEEVIIQKPQEKIIEQVIQPKVEYIEQAPQVIEKVINIPGEIQYVDKIVEKIVPQIEIQEKIIEVERIVERVEKIERLDENITWVDKVVEIPVDKFVEVKGPPRYVEHKVEVPVFTTKQVKVPIDVHHQETIEHEDKEEINHLQSRLQHLQWQCEQQGINWQEALHLVHRNPVQKKKVIVKADQSAISLQGSRANIGIAGSSSSLALGNALTGGSQMATSMSSSSKVTRSKKEIARVKGQPDYQNATISQSYGGFVNQ